MAQVHRHIFLTGFMGSGKSTLGKNLAAKLSLAFTDLDAFIEEREKRSIAGIFEKNGEVQFRALENKYLTEICSITEPAVIALGGGTVCFKNNLELIKNAGLLIYIQLSAGALASRLSTGTEKRPLLKGLSGDTLLKEISERLAAREPFYRQAHLVIDGLNTPAKQLAQKIVDHFNAYGPF